MEGARTDVRRTVLAKMTGQVDGNRCGPSSGLAEWRRMPSGGGGGMDVCDVRGEDLIGFCFCWVCQSRNGYGQDAPARHQEIEPKRRVYVLVCTGLSYNKNGRGDE